MTIAPNAVFQIGSEEMGEDEGFSMFGFSFSSSADLMVGQDVQVRPGMVSSSNGGATLTTDLVRLWPSQITGQVASINGNNGTFSFSGLSPLFTGATPPVNSITVMTLSNMDFEDFSNQGPLGVGNTVSVKGLLFNSATIPTLVTRTIEDHQ